MSSRVLARGGMFLGREYHLNGWSAYIGNDLYCDSQQVELVEALLVAQQEEFNALLPEGCHWNPSLSEVTGPADLDLDGDELEYLMEKTDDKVSDRFEEIEATILGVTLYETVGPTLVIAKGGVAWGVGVPCGDYLDGTFGPDAEAWSKREWEPNEVDGQTPTVIDDDLIPVAVWVPGGVRLLVNSSDDMGFTARRYLNGSL